MRNERVAGAKVQWLGRCVACLVVLLASAAQAQLQHLGATKLPFTAGTGTLGDLAFGGDEFAALYSPLDGSLRLFRYSLAGSTRLDRTIGNPASFYYEPSLCWDGAGYAIASSTITQAEFMKVDEAGNAIVPSFGLPGIPFGGRTAAFRIRCVADGYAVFGLVLTPSVPGSSVYFTGIHYWKLNAAGVVQDHVDLGLQLAPISYVGTAGVGTEKEYYDVALAGDRMFFAYAAECGSPLAFQSCISVFDTAGSLTRGEAPATFPPTQGAHLATNGVTVAVATLRQDLMPPIGTGNQLYVRFFDEEGVAYAAAQRYDAAGDFPTGYAPTIFLHQGQFFPTYVYPDPFTLEYRLKYRPFDAAGVPIAATQTITDPNDYLNGATINLGIDLQLVSAGTHLMGKGQDGIVTITPLLFLVPEPSFAGALLGGTAALFISARARRDSRRCRSGIGLENCDVMKERDESSGRNPSRTLGLAVSEPANNPRFDSSGTSCFAAMPQKRFGN